MNPRKTCAFTRFRVLRTTVHHCPPMFMTSPGRRPAAAGERPRTGVNEPQTEPMPRSGGRADGTAGGGPREPGPAPGGRYRPAAGTVEIAQDEHPGAGGRGPAGGHDSCAPVLSPFRLDGEVFNVATSCGYSNLEVFRTAERVTGRSIPVQLCARRPGDPATLVASSEKLKRVLGWEAAHSSLEEIVKSAWDWRLRFPTGYPD